jgi:hypothetical protein
VEGWEQAATGTISRNKNKGIMILYHLLFRITPSSLLLMQPVVGFNYILTEREIEYHLFERRQNRVDWQQRIEIHCSYPGH